MNQGNSSGGRKRSRSRRRGVSVKMISMSSVILLPLLLLLLFSLAMSVKAMTAAVDDSLILMDGSASPTDAESCPCSPETEKCCPFLVCCKIQADDSDATAAGGSPDQTDQPPLLSPHDIKLYAWTIVTVSLTLCFLTVICLFWPICPLYYSTVCYVKYNKDVAGLADQYGEIPSYYPTSMPGEDPLLGNVLVVSHQPSLMTQGKDREVAV